MPTINAWNSANPCQVSLGGTGQATLTNHGVLVGAATSAVTQLSVGTNGQVLIGASAADPAFATLTSTGGTIAYTTGANSLNLDVVAGGGMPWTDVTGTSATMAVNNGYVADNAGLVTLTLPATAAFGSVFRIVGKGAGGWTIAQATGQTIHFLGSNTTTTTGSLSSTTRYDCVELICTTANTDFVVRSSMGNITIV